jgi:chemotaxis-related protein WspB
MLFLLFRLGSDRYVLDAAQIAEIVPFVRIKQVPQGPAGLAGLLDYRGRPVPVFDVSLLALGQATQVRLSTRIVLAHYPPGGSGLLGLMVEKATETIRREPADFAATGLRHDEAPYLGPVCKDQGGLLQWIDVNRLLPDAVRKQLFFEPTAEH